MKKRSFSGNIGIGVFIIGLVCVCVAFCTSSWLVSDSRLSGATLESLGIWTHCFRSLPDPSRRDDPKRYFVGCRWVFDKFTAGWSDIKGFLLPPFMIVTEFFFTLCVLSVLISFGLISLFTQCCDPEQKKYVKLIQAIGYTLLFGGVCGCIAVIVFASLANTEGWMPDQKNNFFGWSFVVAIIGSVTTIIAASLFLVEANIQEKKRKYLKESQTRFQMESRT